MLRWTFAALTLVAFATPGLAGHPSHGSDCHAVPSCAAPCECLPAGPTCCAPAVPECCPAEPTCCAPAAPSCCAPAPCECAPAAPSCCAPVGPCECAPAAPSCCAPAVPTCGCPTDCHGHAHCHKHCAPKKKSFLARLWDMEKRKNKCLKDTFLGWAN